MAKVKLLLHGHVLMEVDEDEINLVRMMLADEPDSFHAVTKVTQKLVAQGYEKFRAQDLAELAFENPE